jgi:hypothetical protein
MFPAMRGGIHRTIRRSSGMFPWAIGAQLSSSDKLVTVYSALTRVRHDDQMFEFLSVMITMSTILWRRLVWSSDKLDRADAEQSACACTGHLAQPARLRVRLQWFAGRMLGNTRCVALFPS